MTKDGLAAFEQRLLNFTKDPMYGFALRHGLDIDPAKQSHDFAPSLHLFGKLNGIGERGFFELKPYRLAKFKQEWNNLSALQQADPNTAKELAMQINHSTGTIGAHDDATTRWIGATTAGIFAPKLMASQLARMTAEPWRAGATILNWQSATPAEKAGAQMFAKNAGSMLATYAGLLAANAGLLAATGSTQQINITNPASNDWMKFKGFGKTLDVSGGMLSTMKFVGNMITIPLIKSNDRKAEYFDKTGEFLRGKLSPAAGTVFDFATGKDFEGNTLPTSNDRISMRKQAQGAHHLNWFEYAGTHMAPIPVQEAVRNTVKAMRDRGLTQNHTNDILNGIIQSAVMGATGAKIGEEPVKPEEN